MKKWVLPVLCFLFSFQVIAAENEIGFNIPPEAPSFFISHEQFMSLTNEEQKTYVKKVREMVLEMSATFPYVADEMSARSDLFKFFMNIAFPGATAADSEGFPDQSLTYVVERSLQNAMGYYKQINSAKFSALSESEKQLLIEKYRQSLYWVSVAAAQANKIQDSKLRKKTLDTVVTPASRAVLSNETKIKTIASDSDISYARDVVLKRSIAGDESVTMSFPYPGLKAVGEKIEEQKLPDPVAPPTAKDPTEILPPPPPAAPDAKDPKLPKTPETPAVPEPKNPTLPKTPEVPEQSTPKKPQLPNPSVPDLMKPPSKDLPGINKPKPTPAPIPESSSYRCIYAGFVIKKDPCLSTRELPWNLAGLDEAKFKCDRPKMMCNPFVFGFKTGCDWAKALANGTIDKCFAEAKPYCIARGLSATKACGEMSNNSSSLQAAVELIKKNKTAFNEFGQSFQDLCHKNMINFNSYPRKRTPENIARTRKDIKQTCEVAAKRMKEVEKRYGLSKEKDTSAPKKAPTGKDLLMWKSDEYRGEQ